MSRRRLQAVVGLVLLALAVVISPANAVQPECQVVNLPPKKALYNSNTHANPLGSAIAEADAGDTLQVIGTCYGNFVIRKELTLKGRSSDQHEDVIDGSGAEGHAVLYGSGADITVRDLTIRGGREAGILEAGAHLSVIRAHVTDNYLGVVNDALASTTIEDSVISDNQGCGVVGGFFGSITVSNSEVRENGGCGVSGARASVTISGSQVADNGGVGVAGSRHIQVSNSVIEGNTTEGGGGGIAAYDLGTLDLTDSTVSDNTARRGGGIFLDRGMFPMTITGSIVTGNTATEDGGGIYGPGESLLSIANSTVSDNTANRGGGMFLFAHPGGRAEITNSTLTGNTAPNGGGIYSQGALTIDNSTVSDNTTRGIFNDGALVVSDSTLTRNVGGAVGGGSNATALAVTNSTISENSGGISAYAGLVTVSNTLVIRNAGTGIANFGSATVTIEGSTVSENTSPNYPGIYNSLATMTIRNSVVSDNTATGTSSYPGNGGAIGTRGHLTVENSTVSGNEAMLGGKGGGIYRLMLSNLVITESAISGNTAAEGGAIYPITMTGVTLNGTNNLCGNTPDDWFGCLLP